MFTVLEKDQEEEEEEEEKMVVLAQVVRITAYIFFLRYIWDDQIKQDHRGEACSTHVGR
jgi:hypothetical protein